jgi:hypothetical protein
MTTKAFSSGAVALLLSACATASPPRTRQQQLERRVLQLETWKSDVELRIDAIEKLPTRSAARVSELESLLGLALATPRDACPASSE